MLYKFFLTSLVIIACSALRLTHVKDCGKNTKFNALSKIICLRKFEVSGERISICNVIEKLAEHGIHCLPCSYTNDVIDMLSSQL